MVDARQHIEAHELIGSLGSHLLPQRRVIQNGVGREHVGISHGLPQNQLVARLREAREIRIGGVVQVTHFRGGVEPGAIELHLTHFPVGSKRRVAVHGAD